MAETTALTTMCYSVREINGVVHADVIRHFNAMAPECFPALEERHYRRGYWWLALCEDDEVAGFAGLVPNEPYDMVGVGYMKRAFVKPCHRGRGLQRQFMEVRERKALQLGWKMLVGECDDDNDASMRNFQREGFARCKPEQPWGPPGSAYFVKLL